MHIDYHPEQGYGVYQRFNFGRGQANTKQLFEKDIGTEFKPYEKQVGSEVVYGKPTSPIEREGIISFHEHVDDLSKISFARFVELYYKRAREYSINKNMRC